MLDPIGTDPSAIASPAPTLRHHFSSVTCVSIELPSHYVPADEVTGGHPIVELLAAGAWDDELPVVPDDGPPAYGAGYLRLGLAGDPIGRLEIDILPGIAVDEETATIDAVLNAITAQGGQEIERAEQMIDRRRVHTRVIRYRSGLPDRDDRHSTLVGPGATMLVAAVVFAAHVRTLVFLSEGATWPEHEFEFRRALASCRFLDGGWPGAGMPIGGPGAAGDVPVCLADPDRRISLCAPPGWTVDRDHDHLRFAAPDQASFTLRLMNDPPPGREAFARLRADRLATLRAAHTPAVDRGEVMLADGVLVGIVEYESPIRGVQLQGWIWAGPGRAYAVGAATPADSRARNLACFTAMLRSVRILPGT